MELGVFNEPGFAQPRSKTFRPSNFEEPSVGDVDASVKYKKYAGPSKYTGPSLADLEEEYDQMMREKYRKAKAENRALPGQVGNDRMYYIQSRMREYLSGNK